MSQKILNKRSSVFNKTPLPSQIEVGEIAINFNHENPFLSILDSNGEIQKFLSETKTRGLIQDAKEDIDNSFYTKEEINNMFEAFDPSGEVDFDNYYTKSESDSKYQPISGMSSYLTVASAENLYQPKGNYLTEHQSLENYYTKSEADNKFLTSHQDLSGYALKSEIPSIEGLATEEELANYQPQSAMTGYSTTAHTHDYSEIENTPDLSGFASLSDIPDISDLATKSEIPDVSNFVTSAFTDATYAKKGEAPTDVYTKAETDSKFQPQSGMTDYALKSELPSTTGLASEEWVSNNFSSTAHTHSDLATKSDLENYLTIVSASTTYARKSDIPDISDLATKSEIPDVSNFVTSAFTDATYAKKGEVPSDAYTKAETDTLLAGKANSAHTHTMSEITDLDIPKTWRGTLAEYNNLTEIDNDTLYIITDSSEQLVTSGDVESMISGYTNLTEVQTLLEGYSTTSHTHDYSEIENTPDLSGFASLSDIPDTSNFITSAFTEEHYMKIGSTPSAGYVQNIWVGSLSDYENLTVVDSNILYCITDEQEQLVTRSYAMNTFATKAMMSDYLTVSAATEMFVEKEAEPLPAYQFVDYIDVSGNNPGIITDYYLTANSMIEFDSEPASANDNMTLYGVTDADWGGMTEGVYAKYGFNYYTYHGYMAESVVQDVSSGRHTFKAGYNYGGEAMAGCQVDDGEIQTCSENYQSWGGQNNLPLGLFGVRSIDYDWNNNLGMKFNGKFYGCKVYEGNTLMRDYVPCVETSTGKVGIFDTLNDSFYETTASASTTVTGSSSAVTATTEETTSGETSGSTSGETSGETTGQTAYTIDTSVYEVGDYIDLNRDTYDLNYLINGDSKFVLDIYLQAGQNYEEMFGIEGGDCFKIGAGDSEGSVGLIFGNYQTRNTQYYIENDGRYVFEMSSGGTVVNGSMVADWSQAGTVYGMTNSHCHLGGLWQVMVEDWGDGPMDMSSLRGEPNYRMYNFKIYEGNTLLRDYRPVKRLSDDAIGWFDVVNQTFMGRDENHSVGEGASLGYNE